MSNKTEYAVVGNYSNFHHSTHNNYFPVTAHLMYYSLDDEVCTHFIVNVKGEVHFTPLSFNMFMSFFPSSVVKKLCAK